MKFLLIDDSVTMRKVVGLALKSGKYEYDEAGNGEEALEKLNNENFGFFLVDINMPGMDGIELTKSIRSLPDYKTTPIVILTTENEQTMIDQGKLAGADDWIVKPFKKEELLQLISKYA